jgi:hypothetical protein
MICGGEGGTKEKREVVSREVDNKVEVKFAVKGGGGYVVRSGTSLVGNGEWEGGEKSNPEEQLVSHVTIVSVCKKFDLYLKCV